MTRSICIPQRSNNAGMGQRKRHHLVARFLLRRFAAKLEGDKSFVWRLGKNTVPKLLSTKDAAVQSNFYGVEDEGLEAALSDAEGRWASTLRRIDAGEPLEPMAAELWYMVYLMAYRTSPIRSAFQATGERFIDHVHRNADDPYFKSGIRTQFEEEFEDMLRKTLYELPSEVRSLFWNNREVLKKKIAGDLESMDVGSLLRNLMVGVKQSESFQSAAKRGHNTALTKLIEKGEGPAIVRPIAWRLLHDPTASVILGDCPVIAIGEPSGATGAPWKFGKDCRAYYMPISPTTILVGLRYEQDSLLSVDEVNVASATLSEAAIFAAADNEDTRKWSNVVGSRWMPHDETELSRMMYGAIRDFGTKGNTGKSG